MRVAPSKIALFSNLFYEFRGTILLCKLFNFKMKVIFHYDNKGYRLSYIVWMR